MLYGDDAQHIEQEARLDHLRASVYEKARLTDEYKAGVERWRSCMRARGFSYSEPGVAADALAEEFESGRLEFEQLREKELAIATAEATCYNAAGLPAVLESARVRAEEQVGQENRELLEAILARQAEALARAAGLAGSATSAPGGPRAGR